MIMMIIINFSLYGPYRALASVFGFLNLDRLLVGLLRTTDQIVAKASTDTGQHNI
jgi:hypothetical protein